MNSSHAPVDGAFAVSWTEMADGTKDDYERLGDIFERKARADLADSLLETLGKLAGPKLGYQIDRYQHCLQSATRALRAGERDDMVVMALLHDVGDAVAPHNHSEVAAAILRPYVDDEAHWIVAHHGLCQGYYYFHHVGGDRDERERYKDSPHYDACIRFCEEYDQNCFDPGYPNEPIETFKPMVEAVLARPLRWELP